MKEVLQLQFREKALKKKNYSALIVFIWAINWLVKYFKCWIYNCILHEIHWIFYVKAGWKSLVWTEVTCWFTKLSWSNMVVVQAFQSIWVQNIRTGFPFYPRLVLVFLMRWEKTSKITADFYSKTLNGRWIFKLFILPCLSFF